MLLDFRVATRGLLRNPLHALVSIVGFALGLGFCLLQLAYSRYSWSYDTHVPDVDQVYVLKHKRNWELGKPWFDQIPMAMRQPAKSVPGVAEVTGYTNWFPFTVETPQGLQAVRSLMVLPGFTRLMNVTAVEGDLDAALDRPDAIAITVSAALRLFGTTHVLGETVKLRLSAVDANVSQVRIDAVLEDPPANTTVPFELLHGLELTILPPWAKNEALLGEYGFQGGYLLVKLAPGASVDQVTAALQEKADHSPLQAMVPDFVRIRAGKEKFAVIKLSPLRDAYMDPVALNMFSPDVPRGDARLVTGLTAVGLLLLALAAINYVNFATLRMLRRQREILIAKVLGVSRRRLALQFVTESLLVSLVATALGIGLAVAALPAFGHLMGRNLGGMLTGANLASAVGIGLLAGLFTAIYPALLALRARPARILSGRDAGESREGRRLRQVLSVLQLSLAMALASIALAISLQTRHAMQSPLGFDASRQLVAALPLGMSAKFDEPARGFITELSQKPAIAGVAVASEPGGSNLNRGFNNFQREGGELAFLATKAVSANFFEVHGIAAAAGRLFTSEDDEDTRNLVVINVAAARALGFAKSELAVGQKLRMLEQNKGMVEQEIVGVAPDVRYDSLREAPGPLVYDLFSAGDVLIVKPRDTLADAERAMFELWPRYFPNSVFTARPAQSLFDDNYVDDVRLARLLVFSALIALLIAAGGAYALAVDAVQRRSREIALRKLFGAKRGHVGVLLARELGALVLIAGLIALPVSGLAIAHYLAPFIDRTPLAYGMFAVALAMVALAVAAAATRQTWRAMRLRPAAVLRG